MCIFCPTAILNKACQKVPNIKVMSHGHPQIASANAESSFSIGRYMRYIHACMGSRLRRKQSSFTFCQSIKIRLIIHMMYVLCFHASGAGSKGNIRIFTARSHVVAANLIAGPINRVSILWRAFHRTRRRHIQVLDQHLRANKRSPPRNLPTFSKNAETIVSHILHWGQYQIH